MTLSYIEKREIVRNYVKLPFRTRKNFDRREKWYLSYYYNLLRNKGIIEEKDGNIFQKVKIVKNNKSNLKGAPRLKGRVVRGASPNDRVRGNKIFRDNLTKTFVKLDFTFDSEDEQDIKNEISKEIKSKFRDIDLKPQDYFTVVLIGGAEFGQNQRKKTKKSERREGRAYGTGLQKSDKINEIIRLCEEIILRAITKYKPDIEDIVSGVYIYRFKNQRKPTKKETRLIKRKNKE